MSAPELRTRETVVGAFVAAGLVSILALFALSALEPRGGGATGWSSCCGSTTGSG